MQIIKNELHKHDGKLYDLVAYSIMSNHVHILIDTSIQLESNYQEINLIEKFVPLDQIMKLIKGASASYSNKALSRLGKFWEREGFDIYIRNEKMQNNVIHYILNNPVKCGIVNN